MTAEMKSVLTTAKSRLLNDYKIVKKIGDSGKAYKCQHIINNKTFAVKRISKRTAQIKIKRIKTEVDIMKNLNHEYIIKYKQCYEDNDWAFIVMELCEGGELFDRVKQKRRYKEQEAAPIIKMVLEGLYYLHESANVVHGDIKPSNLLFVDKTETSSLKIIDFGESKKINKSQKYTGCMHGTYYYMSPEVLNGEYLFAGDMWAVGCVLFVMIFGYQPFGLDESKFSDSKILGQAICKLVKNGFDATVKQGYGCWFPKSIRVSNGVKDLIAGLLKYDCDKRLTVKQALEHPWIINDGKNVHSAKPLLPLLLMKSIWTRLT